MLLSTYIISTKIHFTGIIYSLIKEPIIVMLHDFLMAYGGNVCISIVGFCEEAEQSEVMTSD